VYDTSAPAIEYRRNKSISTTSAWSAATTVASGDNSYLSPAMVAHREGTGWKTHMCSTRRNTIGGGSIKNLKYTLDHDHVSRCDHGGRYDRRRHQQQRPANTTTGIDFHHTATDEKAVQSSAPRIST
jgi:hypothetical protein